MRRPILVGLVAGAQVMLGALPVWGAQLDAGQRADLIRAIHMVGPSASAAPAVRSEQQVGQPSPAFMLGAALGAWTSARAQVAFDARAPEAAGPPHNSQSGDTDDYIRQDCAEEASAFADLEARRRALGLQPAEVLAAAGLTDTTALTAWRARAAGPAATCR